MVVPYASLTIMRGRPTSTTTPHITHLRRRTLLIIGSPRRPQLNIPSWLHWHLLVLKTRWGWRPLSRSIRAANPTRKREIQFDQQSVRPTRPDAESSVRLSV